MVPSEVSLSQTGKVTWPTALESDPENDPHDGTISGKAQVVS